MAKLTKEDLVTIQTLTQRGQSAQAIGRMLDVDESTIRYHQRRQASAATDGRRKRFLIEELGLDAVARQWWADEQARLPADRSPNATALYEFLSCAHDYGGSQKSVRKFVAQRLGRPAKRPFRRVEVPPGSQVQIDWSEHRDVLVGLVGVVTVYVLHLQLGHSRRQVDIACLACDQLAWQHGHLEAFRRLGGVPATGRIDNLKTGVASGSGAWGIVNQTYLAFARDVGFHVDLCPVRMPRAKGKVERGVRTFRTADFRQMAAMGLEPLQAWLDTQSEARDRRRRCPATGTSVWEAWEGERDLLRPLPADPIAPFDIVLTRPVQRDCLVNAEGRQYSVPYAYAGTTVEVRGTSQSIEIRSAGSMIARWPRGTEARLLVDPAHYQAIDDCPVPAPLPLGAIGQRLVELAAGQSTEAPLRSIDIYAQLCEVVAERDARLAAREDAA